MIWTTVCPNQISKLLNDLGFIIKEKTQMIAVYCHSFDTVSLVSSVTYDHHSFS